MGDVRGPPVVRGAAADPPDAEGRRRVRGGAAAGGGALCVRRYHRHRPRAADHRVDALNQLADLGAATYCYYRARGVCRGNCHCNSIYRILRQVAL